MVNLVRKALHGCSRIATGVKIALFPQDYFVYTKAQHQHHKLSYSQEGEDRLIFSFFRGKKQGFFVDVGAFHPQQFSNTYLFYSMGWRGINIDARPNSMAIFDEIRPEDINLEFSIHDSDTVLPYYEFAQPAFNSLSSDMLKRRVEVNNLQPISQKDLKTHRLDSVLDRYLPTGQAIDFFSVDVEGLDLEVLKSNNWDRYRPRLVVTEDLDCRVEDLAGSKIASFLTQQGYYLHAKAGRTLFFAEGADTSPV